ncbi:MAG: DUF2059 domain-containing protein [Flavobacteriales bacterium]|nr:DUF2059 domain-containing protein [Flavobacteriales bacterium]
MKYLLLSLQLMVLLNTTYAQQVDTTIFARINEQIQHFVPDTANVPVDSVTYRIRELRALKGGFNIQEAMAYKLTEALGKQEISDSTYQALSTYIESGNGKRLLDNAITAIYRDQFTYAELGDLIAFYSSPTGQKIARETPLIIVASIKSAEFVMALSGSTD